jgi:hypothetical protein
MSGSNSFVFSAKRRGSNTPVVCKFFSDQDSYRREMKFFERVHTGDFVPGEIPTLRYLPFLLVPSMLLESTLYNAIHSWCFCGAPPCPVLEHTDRVYVMLSPSVCRTAFVVKLKWRCSGAGVVCQGRGAGQRCHACLHSAGAVGLLPV